MTHTKQNETIISYPEKQNIKVLINGNGGNNMESTKQSLSIKQVLSNNMKLVEALRIAISRFHMNKETEDDFNKCVKVLKESEL